MLKCTKLTQIGSEVLKI